MSALIDLPSVFTEHLSNQPYLQVLSYPKLDIEVVEQRIGELRELGIEGFIFHGVSQIGSVRVLGKGCESVVVKAQRGKDVFAMKIRRTDSSRISMEQEAKALSLANSVGVGPRIQGYTGNLLLMQFLPGVRLADWIKSLSGRGSVARLRLVVRELLEQCRLLDKIGLDHGELSNLLKHVLVDGGVHIIDFESSSLNRRMKNITSAVQWLFVGGPLTRKVNRLLNLKDIEAVKDATRRYKTSMNDDSFNILLQCLKVG